MRFAYADPPYLGVAARYYGDHPDAAVYDTVDGHRALIDRLSGEFPDGWAYSLSSQTLRDLLPLCPADVRIGAWVKPWCSWRPGNYPFYAWEPVIFWGGRKPQRMAGRPHGTEISRDWVEAPMRMGRTVTGAKPEQFCRFVFMFLGAQPGDELVDLFPGSGTVGRAWATWCAQLPLADAVEPIELAFVDGP